MADFTDIVYPIPPVTKVYAASSIILTVLSSLDIASPYDFYLNWTLVTKEHQWWRLITCFLWLGELRLQLFWNFYMLVLYAGSLEAELYKKRHADMLWLLITSAGIILVSHSQPLQSLNNFVQLLSAVLPGGNNTVFFGNVLSNALMYNWCRRHPFHRRGFGLFHVDAAYIPWIAMTFDFILGKPLFQCLGGIAVGHIYYFFQEVYPLMPTSNELKLFAAPLPLRWILGQKDELYED